MSRSSQLHCDAGGRIAPVLSDLRPPHLPPLFRPTFGVGRSFGFDPLLRSPCCSGAADLALACWPFVRHLPRPLTTSLGLQIGHWCWPFLQRLSPLLTALLGLQVWQQCVLASRTALDVDCLAWQQVSQRCRHHEQHHWPALCSAWIDIVAALHLLLLPLLLLAG